jgi:hypothetical protein
MAYRANESDMNSQIAVNEQQNQISEILFKIQAQILKEDLKSYQYICKNYQLVEDYNNGIEQTPFEEYFLKF